VLLKVSRGETVLLDQIGADGRAKRVNDLRMRRIDHSQVIFR
jgi:hypothetical protein